MAQKVSNHSQWIWQDYVGATWSNLTKGNTWGGDDATYCTVKGYDSQSNYRPKSVFYHYQMSGFDSSKHKIDSIKFTVIFGRKTSTSTNALPTLKVFYGDNNAPYKKEPLYTTSAYALKSNYYDFDTYTVEYTIKNVSFTHLQNLICELDWKKSKVKGDSTVSINRASLTVNYSYKNPKWSLYNTLYKYSEKTSGTIGWKLTMKNTGYCGNGTVVLKLPKGMSVASSNGGGTYNNSTKTWTVKGCNGDTITRVFYLKSKTVGEKNIVANQTSPYATNVQISRIINFIPSDPPKPPVNTHRDDIITYTPYDVFEKEENQYIDVNIQGFKENHPFGGACYEITSSSNVELNTPLRTYVELLDDNLNIKELVRDSTVEYDGIVIELDDNTVCFKLDNPNEDFVANIRIYMYCTDDTFGTITTDANNIRTVGEFDILPCRGWKFFTDSEISRDKAYVQNSINIGVPNIWTLRAKSNRHSFFDERKDLMEIEIEQAIAYIGVIPLERCHKADVTATSKNTLIENRYLNRAYYGKKGDYSEDIKMTLRMHWTDVATLQGLCEMDKPIPIDTIPYFADGDPLNHRGWAEIYEVSNIKKINDMLYECDVGVKYLTHDILTRFNIKEAQKITQASIEHYLTLIHNYGDDILELFKLNFYEFWTTLEDANGDKIGSYDIDPNASLKMNSDLNKNSTYDIIWRNSLPVLRSEDYDGNWEMALRVKNKETDTTLFEHSYGNYQHYDFTNNYPVNTADATTKHLVDNNNYETLNFEKISLGYDNLSPLIEDRKIPTHFNSMETTTITNPFDPFEIFLLDGDNKGISNQTVKVDVSSDDGYSDSFNVMTDIYGRAIFKLNLDSNPYDLRFTFYENDTYRGCTYNTAINLDFNDVKYHFSYQQTPTVLTNDYEYLCTLLDENEDGVSGMMLHYSFKDTGTNRYGYERTVVTDSNGDALIPIDWDNGTKTLKVTFKGFADNGTVYEPCYFENEININIVGEDIKIDADDVTLIQGDVVKDYNILVRDMDDTPIPNKEINISFYNNDLTFAKTVNTNEFGVASIPLYLTGDTWYVDIHFKGDGYYKPQIQTHTITIEKFQRLGTYIDSENLALDEDELLSGDQDYYTIYLKDVNDAPVVDEPVRFRVENGNEIYVDTVLVTDNYGMISLPFISHSESVMITANYYGCVGYEPCENIDEVVFAEKTGRANVSFSVDNSTNSIKVTENTVSKKINENDNIHTVIVTKPNNYRQTSSNGIIDYTSLNTGTFNVTVLYTGNDTYYSKMRTIQYTHNTDTRLTLQNYADLPSGSTGYTLEAFGGDEYYENLYKYPIWANWDCGKTSGSWFFFEWSGTVQELINYINENGGSEWMRENADYSVKSVSTQKELVDAYGEVQKMGKWGFDAFIVQPVGTIGLFLADDTDHYIIENLAQYSCTNQNSREDATITQTGFARDGETYQDITVILDSEFSTLDEQINEYYVMRLINTNTLEELLFYSYLIDKSTISELEFLLVQGDWELQLVGKETDTYKATSYQTTGTIDTETTIDPPQTSSFTDSENYESIGEDDITIDDNGISFINGGLNGK